MKAIPRVMLALFVTSFLIACDPADRVSDDNIEPIDYKQLVTLREDPDADMVLVDVRREKDYVAGHIPGAIHIFLGDINRSDRRVLAAKLIVVYDSGQETDDLARAATKVLLKSGYGAVREFRGGMREWQAKGGTIEIEVNPSTDG